MLFRFLSYTRILQGSLESTSDIAGILLPTSLRASSGVRPHITSIKLLVENLLAVLLRLLGLVGVVEGCLVAADDVAGVLARHFGDC